MRRRCRSLLPPDLRGEIEIADAVAGFIRIGVDRQRIKILTKPAGELTAALLDGMCNVFTPFRLRMILSAVHENAQLAIRRRRERKARGNFFAGISLHADRPFQVGDVIVVGSQKHTGVVESITWRAIKIRTFQNHIVLVANSTAAKEAIEVAPRDNLNARIVTFSTIYTDSPAKTIHVVREAVRDADNVSEKITPIVRIRGLGDSSIDWEIKYWLDDYAKYNDTDALVRQRVWYTLRRSGLTFAFPTRTLYLERSAPRAVTPGNEIADRLSAVDIFAPLSNDELRQLADATVTHVFAPGETLIRAGDEGSSMFVVHSGKVSVQVSDRAGPRKVAELTEGNFFGEMALFTGEPRTANVVAMEETEVLEIGHAAMKHLFDTNPSLAESISLTIAERQADLARGSERAAQTSLHETEGLLSSIKRFFGLH